MSATTRSWLGESIHSLPNLTPMLIDSHCHLESFVKAKTLRETLDRAKAAGVGKLIAVGTDIDDWAAYRDLAAAYPNFIYHTVGLHPCHVETGWHDAVVAIGPMFIDRTMPVALGEIGLDYFRLPAEANEASELKKLQEAAFRQQLTLAYQFECPVVVHSRAAFADTVRMIDESGVDWEKVVFHCFSEGPDEVRELNRRGGRASFTGILTYPSAGAIRAAAEAQGLDKLMLETDCPYLAPQAVRGQVNEPAHLAHIARYAAGMFGVSLEELTRTTEANTRAFYGM